MSNTSVSEDCFRFAMNPLHSTAHCAMPHPQNTSHPSAVPVQSSWAQLSMISFPSNSDSFRHAMEEHDLGEQGIQLPVTQSNSDLERGTDQPHKHARRYSDFVWKPPVKTVCDEGLHNARVTAIQALIAQRELGTPRHVSLLPPEDNIFTPSHCAQTLKCQHSQPIRRTQTARRTQRFPNLTRAQNSHFPAIPEFQPVQHTLVGSRSCHYRMSPPVTASSYHVSHPTFDAHFSNTAQTQQITELVAAPVKKTWAEKHRRKGRNPLRKWLIEHRNEVGCRRMGEPIMYVTKDHEGDVIMREV